MMKFPGARDQNMKEMFLEQFEESGITPERIQVEQWRPSVEHLQLYGQVDIALDTYPFNGCITTLEGLWMGVPIVSLVGKNSLLSRSGLSILSRIGLEFFAAENPNEFVTKATAIAQNLPALTKIRASLRNRMTVSPLCDAKGYAENLEKAYRMMWHRWCESRGVDAQNVQSENSDTISCSSGLSEVKSESVEGA
jgi:predicted O-linked N-acetylglucosamine transferase (SPINDLY family)